MLLREGLVRLLEDSGFEVAGQAGDAEDLLRKVGAHKPDVAVIDVRMPPSHTDEGLRAARKIRAEHPGTGVLVLSQYVEEAYALDLLSESTESTGYLLKDRVADVDTFTDAVRRVAGGGSALDPGGRGPAARPPPPRGPAGGPHGARARGARADGRGPLQRRHRRGAGRHRARRGEARHLDLLQARPGARRSSITAACSPSWRTCAPASPTSARRASRTRRRRVSDDAGPMNIVSTADLRRTYGEGETAVHALAGVTLSFPAGQFTAIMGPSGSGKSTLMHLLAGLDSPTSGSVVIDGQELAGLDDKGLTRLRRDRLGFVFQAFNLVPVLTAEENITLPLTLAGREPDQAWLDKLIDTVGLRDRLTHRPAELSGGQQQRVAVARALVHRPAVVFADEPTGNLDSHSSEEVLGLLRQAVDEFDQTVIMVTHDAQAAAVADRHRGAPRRRRRPRRRRHRRRGRARPDEGRGVVTKLALKGLLSRKLRSVLTGFAVVIGVAFVVGTLVFTDTIDASFKNLFERTQQGVDVAVEARQAVKADFSAPPTMPADTLDKVKASRASSVAEGSVSSDGTLLDKQGQGDHLQRPADADRLGLDREDLPGPRLREGGRAARPPTRSRSTAARPKKYGFKLGDTVTVTSDAPAKQYKVSGIATIGGKDNLAGREAGRDDAARGAADDRPRRLRLDLGLDRRQRPGRRSRRRLQRSSGATSTCAPARRRPSSRRRTSPTRSASSGRRCSSSPRVALLVGGFLIFNTFTVTVAQRTKEFALLRVLGASRRAGAALGADRDVRGRRARVGARRARRHRARARAGGDAQGVRDRPRARPAW